MTRTYTGSCHCKAVRYEVDLDLSQGTMRCNCTFCAKVRNWTTRTTPEHFRLLTPESGVSGSGWPGVALNEFCSKCGVRTFSRGNLPELGGAFVTIMVSTLDDASVDELLSGPIQYADGLHDNWWNAPQETRHL
jgi:hypothetical protein